VIVPLDPDAVVPVYLGLVEADSTYFYLCATLPLINKNQHQV
jgi:hypothetical protein